MNNFYRWQIGDVRITRVQELEAPGMRFLLPDASPEDLAPIAWLAPFLDERGHALGSIHSLVIEVDDRRILIDTCIGNDKDRGRMKLWSMRQGPFLDHLAEAGFPAETIDTVVCTHLHIDHVGWNTRLVGGKWIPTFPNARYLLGRAEWDFWKDEPDEYGPVIDDSVRPIFEADLVDLVDVDHVVASGIQLESTPGHTPGHVSVHVSSRGEEAVVTGDLVHHPCQFAHPDWDDTADWNAEMALATRLDFMARYAGTPTLIIGTHFAGPTAGHIVRDGEVYRLDI
jgi:glyoxylase-like metal-dependent hydrolase (beta-lactamase superfamily II)